MKILFNGSVFAAGIFNFFLSASLKKTGGCLPKRTLLTILLISAAVSAGFTQESNIEAIMTEITQHLARRDYISVLSLFDAMEAESPEISILRASILNAAGRPAEARAIANAIIAADSSNTDALMILADAAALENKDRDRRTYLERVISINPNHTRALNDMANINLGNQNLLIAANYFDRALSSDPDNGDALLGRAMVYRYSREPANAERLLNRAVNLYPAWAGPFQERARLYRSYGFYNDALEDFGTALAIEPENYWVLVDYGQTLMEMSRPEEALSLLERAIIISPNDFLAYAYSSAIRDEMGDYAGAERDYLTLARLKPDYYFAYEAVGIIRMRNRQWAGARDAFLEAYKYAPREYNRDLKLVGDEMYSYAILAALNWMRAGRQTDPKTFLAQVLRTAPLNTVDYYILRLLHDLSGDDNAVRQVDAERNIYAKARGLYYIASYFDIRGSRTLADRYHLMVQDLDAAGLLEWRLNEIILTERGLSVRNAK